MIIFSCFFFQAEDLIRDIGVTGVQTCALPISMYYIMTGDPFDGKKAAEMRLVTSAVPRERLREATLELAGKLLDKIGRASCRERVEISVAAVSLTKKIYSSSLGTNVNTDFHAT